MTSARPLTSEEVKSLHNYNGTMGDAFDECMGALDHASRYYDHLVKSCPELAELQKVRATTYIDELTQISAAYERALMKYPVIWAARARLHALQSVAYRVANMAPSPVPVNMGEVREALDGNGEK